MSDGHIKIEISLEPHSEANFPHIATLIASTLANASLDMTLEIRTRQAYAPEANAVRPSGPVVVAIETEPGEPAVILCWGDPDRTITRLHDHGYADPHLNPLADKLMAQRLRYWADRLEGSQGITAAGGWTTRSGWVTPPPQTYNLDGEDPK